jgi:acetylglutamate kinase
VAGATAGVLDARGGTIPVLGFRDIDALVSGGGATAGMVAKLASCRHAVRSGVREVWIAGGGDVAGLEAVLRRGARAGVSGSTRVVAAAAPARQRGVRRGVGSRHNGPPVVQVP